ncbi:hypothetical protein BASA81_001443 [Batrachochytrium salamandrivorans]|nr:hypothetical protein BASA81_001443 [Batrachochytrium salamandrivorans]
MSKLTFSFREEEKTGEKRFPLCLPGLDAGVEMRMATIGMGIGRIDFVSRAGERIPVPKGITCTKGGSKRWTSSPDRNVFWICTTSDARIMYKGEVLLSTKSTGEHEVTVNDSMVRHPLRLVNKKKPEAKRQRVCVEEHDNEENGNHLKELGLNVIHTNTDFFTNQIDYDIIITNPPFSNKKAVLEKLMKDGKPFIMIMPISVICTKMYSKFLDEGTIVMPRSRIQFARDGKTTQGKCPFDSFYYYWRMNLGKQLIRL